MPQDRIPVVADSPKKASDEWMADRKGMSWEGTRRGGKLELVCKVRSRFLKKSKTNNKQKEYNVWTKTLLRQKNICLSF